MGMNLLHRPSSDRTIARTADTALPSGPSGHLPAPGLLSHPCSPSGCEAEADAEHAHSRALCVRAAAACAAVLNTAQKAVCAAVLDTAQKGVAFGWSAAAAGPRVACVHSREGREGAHDAIEVARTGCRCGVVVATRCRVGASEVGAIKVLHCEHG